MYIAGSQFLTLHFVGGGGSSPSALCAAGSNLKLNLAEISAAFCNDLVGYGESNRLVA